MRVINKVKIIWSDDGFLDLENKINDFIKYKEIVDIKFSTDKEMVLVVYKEIEKFNG